MGQDWGPLTVPVNGVGNTPDVEEVKSLISFSNIVPSNRMKNGDMESWENGVGTAPKFWTLSGTGASVARTTDKSHGTYALTLTFGSATAQLRQAVSANDLAYLKGKQVKLWAAVKTSNANEARLRIDDGVGVSSSPFHNGNSLYQILEVTRTIDASATKVEAVLEMGGNSGQFDEIVLLNFSSIRQWIPHLPEVGLPLGFRRDTIDNRGTPDAPEIFFATGISQFFIFTGDSSEEDNGWHAF